METRKLGSRGPQVSAIGFGAMSIGIADVYTSSVRDDAAAYLSVETVKRYGGGADPAEALRRAMLGMIDGKPVAGSDQPVNWAPFVFVGR